MTWNYRIVRHRTRHSTWFGLHEVYYKKNGKINLWSPKPSATGDSVKDLIGGLGLQIRDATRYDTLPVLDQKDMPGREKRSTTCDMCGRKLKATRKR